MQRDSERRFTFFDRIIRYVVYGVIRVCECAAVGRAQYKTIIYAYYIPRYNRNDVSREFMAAKYE